MIATIGYTGTDQTTITYISNTYSSYTGNDYDDIYIKTSETLNEMSLRRLRELMFVPRKTHIKKSFPIIKKQINIRNQLPIKFRICDNNKLENNELK